MRFSTTTTTARIFSQPLLACNVYITAGALPRHAPILLDLLRNTQELCRSHIVQRKKDSDESRSELCVVVHAFADTVYNRSSFHLAGTEHMISDVVSTLVTDARKNLAEESQNNDDVDEGQVNNVENASHPYVGLVDHIAVMPIITDTMYDDKDNTKTGNNQSDEVNLQTPSGRAARYIGESMKGVDVFYYGNADPQRTPLAEVRRKKTSFFHSGGLEKKRTADLREKQIDVATVGAPPHFVENFNIRLTQNCDKKTAQSLTKFLRERDGGLPGLEALTLPYSNGRFEVACNLLQPHIGSTHAIENKVKEWAAKVIHQAPEKGRSVEDLVETAYRVGTTEAQCVETLSSALDPYNEILKEHDNQILNRFKTYLATN